MVVLILLFSPILIFSFLIISKKKRYRKLSDQFNHNMKAIERLEIDDFKLGSGHLYD